MVHFSSLSRRILYTAFAITGCVVLSQPAHADFSGYYDVSNWNIGVGGTNGSVDTSGAPASVTINGGDQPPGGEGGYVSFSILTETNSFVSFNWNYSTTDGASAADPFTFGVNSSTLLAQDDIQTMGSGFFGINVNAGDNLNFTVRTVDNTGGPATVVLSNFSAVVVPEAGTLALALPALGILGAIAIRRHAKK